MRIALNWWARHIDQMCTCGVKIKLPVKLFNTWQKKGQNFKLKKHVNWLIKTDEAGAYIDEPNLSTGSEVIETSFTVSPEFPSVSLISMIAPSPDWFVGVSSLNLCSNSAWVPEYKQALFVYDGGTDSGDRYAYATKETTTTPKETIKHLQNARFGISTEKPFGSITFRRQ